MTTIDLTPTPEGYGNIVLTFAESILGDVRKARQTDSRALMASLIQNVAYLGAINRGDLIAQLVKRIER